MDGGSSGAVHRVALHQPCRLASSSARRPTYSEISEALAILGFGNVNYEEKELKKRYRELVKKNHPDAGGDEKAMARIAVAYERLSNLSKREREEFKRQQNAFSGRMRAGTYASPYQDHRYAHQSRRAGGPTGFQQETPSGYGSQYYQQDSYPGQAGAHSSNAYWNYYHRMQQQQQQQQQQAGRSGGQGFAENPFSSKNPFSFYSFTQRMRFVSPGSLFIQGLVLYLFLSMLLLFSYRALRDYLHEDGWKMSDSLARHEQMQELHRLRQEMKERADLYRDVQQRQQQASGGSNLGHAFFYDSRTPNELRNPHVGETGEQRALEYARQRRLQIMEEQRRMGSVGASDSSANLLNGEASIAHLPELKGWPRISEYEGRIIKRAQDPPGVVFFEPRQVDARARQIFNRMRGIDKAAAGASSPSSPSSPSPSAALSNADGGENESATAGDPRNGRPIGVPVLSAAAAVEAAGLPPAKGEANVGSVFAAQIHNNADAREAMNTIFGAMREARARNDSH